MAAVRRGAWVALRYVTSLFLPRGGRSVLSRRLRPVRHEARRDHRQREVVGSPPRPRLDPVGIRQHPDAHPRTARMAVAAAARSLDPARRSRLLSSRPCLERLPPLGARHVPPGERDHPARSLRRSRPLRLDDGEACRRRLPRRPPHRPASGGGADPRRPGARGRRLAPGRRAAHLGGRSDDVRLRRHRDGGGDAGRPRRWAEAQAARRREPLRDPLQGERRRFRRAHRAVPGLDPPARARRRDHLREARVPRPFRTTSRSRAPSRRSSAWASTAAARVSSCSG